MDSGLVIAVICRKEGHPTIINFNKFGDKYWDDSNKKHKAKCGYYFAYYYKKEFVYIHRIKEIIPYDKRPNELKEWKSGNSTLYLSPRLKTFTWTEWTTTIGFGAPYTPTYSQLPTTVWPYYELENKFQEFKFEKFIECFEQNEKRHELIAQQKRLMAELEQIEDELRKL
jgi:hypothetical protein